MSFIGKTLGKIVGSHQSKAQSPTNSPESDSTTNAIAPSILQRQHTVTYSNKFHQDAQLTLTHLRKVFYEYLHPKLLHDLSPTEKDEKLYSILPLFIKVNIFGIYFTQI